MHVYVNIWVRSETTGSWDNMYDTILFSKKSFQCLHSDLFDIFHDFAAYK